MNKAKQKLELTWIGKEQRPKLEPRILLEDKAKSYHAAHRVSEQDSFDNMLIHGDNLLALKALETNYAGKIKCIFIDPPYNTGSAFAHYEDGLEHSIWLTMMRDRLDILYRLLKDDGMIFAQIDNRELHYLKILMDEIFGRENYRNSIITRKGAKNVQKQFETVEKLNAGFDTIVMYSKKSDIRIPNLFMEVKGEISGGWNNHWRGTSRPTMRYDLLGIEPKTGQWRWQKERSLNAIKNYKILLKYMNKNKVKNITTQAIDEYYQKYLQENNIDNVRDFELIRLSKHNKPEHYIPPSNKTLLSENWMDISVAGRVTDFEHEKNELILQRIIEWITIPGDLVLDSFAGSGTTGAVAHKMNRRWIMVELGEHCHTHILPRLKKVIDGNDQGGISKAQNWQGGGGFRYFTIAPSLLKKDKWGRYIVNKAFNPEMLAEALCQQAGFTYQPNPDVWWQHGFSSEHDFIYATTQTFTHAQLAKLSAEVGDDRTLFIYCSGFKARLDQFANLTVCRIPPAILQNCEWDRDDYSLKVQNLPYQAGTQTTMAFSNDK